ncbi:hypothetical protein B0H21DRAFT_895083 [Amylocystis lapponica]|nr:hypothetical protein B0H21DRAFT_895083 [Amylocystis lapponica]
MEIPELLRFMSEDSTRKPDSTRDDDQDITDGAREDNGDNPSQHPTLCNIPAELFLEIASFLDVYDILVIRQTCKEIALLTTPKSLWISLLYQQRQDLCIPQFSENYDIAALSPWETQSIVLSTLRIERTWLLPRPAFVSPVTSLSVGALNHNANTDITIRTILSMNVFLDRWLLCIYYEGVIELLDMEPVPVVAHSLDEPASVVRCIRQQVGVICTSSAVCLDTDKLSLIIAVTSQYACNVLRLVFPRRTGLNTHSEGCMETITTIPIPNPLYLVRAIHPDNKLAVFSLTSSVTLVDWSTHQRWTLGTNAEEDELWNGIIGAQILSPHHILCVKVHSIELYTLPALPPAPAPSPHTPPADTYVPATLLIHSFPYNSFRGVSFSAPDRSPPAADTSLTLLAFDVLRGLFHLHVALQLPAPGAAPAHMSVRLLAAHLVAVPVDAAVPRAPRSGLSAGARGFVSACVLGATGRRGVWVERQRGNVRRRVVGFRAGSGEELGEEAQAHEEPDVPPIEGRMVYEVNSYDLRDDITHCTLAEATGRIALGTRDGRIQVL